MIVIGILDTEGLGLCPSLLDTLSKKERKRIEDIKNEKARVLSTGARLLLKRLYEDFFETEMPGILYGEEGKPYFENGNALFSISHDEGIAVVVLTDEGRKIGIDIQSFLRDSDKNERIEKRFLKKLDDGITKPNDEFEFEVRFFSVDKSNSCIKEDISLCDEAFLKNASNSFLLKWTRLEAVLKLFEKGFKDINNVNNNLHNAMFKTVFLQHGGVSFALSVALAKNKKE